MNTPCFYRVSVKGIAFDAEGRVLLAREPDGRWELLGGGLDHGEGPFDCLKREVKEETGLDTTYVSSAPLYFLTFHNPDTDVYIANVIYEIKLASMDFTPTEECQELRFFSLDELKQERLLPGVQSLTSLLAAEHRMG